MPSKTLPAMKSRRKIGARHYANYAPEKLAEALQMIRSGKITQRAASAQYGIPRRTLNYKLKEEHTGNYGCPAVFSVEEELAFVNHIKAVSHFGFPIDAYNLRCIARNYLDRLGRRAKGFKNNFPGKDWVKSFLLRHSDQLSQRMSSNIKLARASVTKGILESYFENLRKELDGVPAVNIWNYDETCLMDDPGLKKVLTKRGVKYPERLCNSSKASTSIMFCGNANGQLAPPYVNYKSEKLWDLWTMGGLPQARYNRTKSGWFDTESFQDWFQTLMLPILKKLDGKKVLLGDNLSSHINLKVLELCKENNISFLCLPPNSTHLTQPLDISVFRPMKIAWRHILDVWKATPSGRRCTTVPKDEFPRLLHQLMEEVNTNVANNLKSGFRKAGIHPFQPNNVLLRIPDSQNCLEISPNIQTSFVDYLEKKRTEVTSATGRGRGRKRKITIEAGKSISFEEIHVQQKEELKRKEQPKKGKQKKKLDESSDSHSNSEMVLDDETDANIVTPEIENENRPSISKKPKAVCELENVNRGDYVIVNYFDELYPGVVMDIEENRIQVSVLHKSYKSWKWPAVKDELWYDVGNVLEVISEPKKLSRGFFHVPELSKYFSK